MKIANKIIANFSLMVATIFASTGCSGGTFQGTSGSKTEADRLKKVEELKERPGSSLSDNVFGNAILTKSVQCFACHLKVEGHVGGIGFPEQKDVRIDSAENFEIQGNLYASNSVPAILKNGAKTALGIPENILRNILVNISWETKENFKNESEYIFPLDSNRNAVFPSFDANSITAEMDGTIKSNGQTLVSKTHSGDLLLEGDFAINGEVYISGNLKLKGRYTGQGTIYAKNIYIVDDLVANTNESVFPFPANVDAALERARELYKSQAPALYLAAINQIVVGSPENKLDLGAGQLLVTEKPYSAEAEKQAFFALGKRPQLFGVPETLSMRYDASWASATNLSDYRVAMEVNRVDAFLLAGQSVSWRAYNNILLNGGLIAPQAGLVSSRVFASNRSTTAYSNTAIAARIADVNSANGLDYKKNVIRYDWRLRVGSVGYKAIRKNYSK